MADWTEHIQEYGEELIYAALSLKTMDDDYVGHFTIELGDVEYIVSIRKHTDGYYDKLASSLRGSS